MRKSKTGKRKPVARKPAAGKKKKYQKPRIQIKLGGAPKNKAANKSHQRKNKSKNISNGTFVVTNDRHFYGADGRSSKVRMSTVVDSNSRDELALVKYTTSKKHGKSFVNDKGFQGHGDRIFTLDDKGKPIKIDGQKFKRESPRRDISQKQANAIKKENLQNSKYKAGNRANLRKLKGRK